MGAPFTAEAAAPMCQGEKATLVGEPGKNVYGTAGRDVVVSRGAYLVVTLDGNDLICMTGTTADGCVAEIRYGCERR